MRACLLYWVLFFVCYQYYILYQYFLVFIVILFCPMGRFSTNEVFFTWGEILSEWSIFSMDGLLREYCQDLVWSGISEDVA